MAVSDEALLDGEREFGQYTVVVVRQSDNGRWMPSVMQLGAVVTNYRLILRPYRKKYTPATLPASYIQNVEVARRGNYHCIEVHLKTGHMLYLMLSTGYLDHLLNDLRKMRVRLPKIHFDESISRQAVERLISFFGQLETLDPSP